jgi:hypothetical protein
MSGATDLTARRAVEAVRSLMLDELGWYPREPSDPDYGIDVYVECADDGVPNGRMFGVQVKGGPSFFREQVNDGVVFRGKQRHLDYWMNHSLPVIVVLYDPDTRTAIWQTVSSDTVTDTGQDWKLVVPRSQPLDASCAEQLVQLAEADAYTQRLNGLRADLSWMRVLADGGAVDVTVAEWINKSSGRGAVELLGTPRQGDEAIVRSRAVYYGLAPYEQVLPDLFPWAHLDVDDDLYEQHEEELWQHEEGSYDKEEGRVIVYGESFQAWRATRGLEGLRPYTVEQGEVAHWRLTLSLNELGRSFLSVDSHLSGRETAETTEQ